MTEAKIWAPPIYGISAVVLAVAHRPGNALALALCGLIISVILHWADRQRVAFFRRQTDECMEGWKRANEIGRAGIEHHQAMMWCDICLFTNLLDLTPIQGRDVVRGAMKLYQERRMVN